MKLLICIPALLMLSGCAGMPIRITFGYEKFSAGVELYRPPYDLGKAPVRVNPQK